MEAIEQGPQIDFNIMYSALSPFITLCLGSIGMDHVISESKVALLQRNCSKMTNNSNNSFVIFQFYK